MDSLVTFKVTTSRRLVDRVPSASEISLPKLQHRSVEVDSGGQVADVMLAHRVDHHVKHFPMLDKRVDKRLGVLRVHVVIVGSMHK